MMGECHKTLPNSTNLKRHKEKSHYLNRLVSDCREDDIELEEVLNASLLSPQGEDLELLDWEVSSDASKAHYDIGLDEVLNASLFSSQGEELEPEDLKKSKFKNQQTKHETCDICGKQLTQKRNITVHIKTQHGEVDHKTLHCGNLCEYLKAHEATSQEGITCSCEHGGDKFDIKCEEQQHGS